MKIYTAAIIVITIMSSKLAGKPLHSKECDSLKKKLRKAASLNVLPEKAVAFVGIKPLISTLDSSEKKALGRSDLEIVEGDLPARKPLMKKNFVNIIMWDCNKKDKNGNPLVVGLAWGKKPRPFFFIASVSPP